ncbi:hypothetical protein BAL199_09480 [alpha proteobacterium BAL199]|nr:hypothetical protein BAL199_09480 [alpha proteobacterium BAL199]
MGVLSAIGRFLFSRTMVILIGVLAISVIIWFAGPYVSLFDLVPLQSVTARVVTIGGIILLFVGLELLRIWRVRRLNRKMIENLTSSQSLTAMTDGTADDDLEVLRQRFEDAMAALKESSVTGRHLYDLPWYLIIGPPGAGKTTILRNSGLQFPLAERLGVEVIEGVGGTRSCDWWLTDQAVLLDTAGRYTTQDINAATDASTWRGFLNILKESRPRQPVNGVIIAISLADILAQDERDRTRTIESVKARLQEIMRGFGIRMPVYVLFTKADLVSGFTEFFEDLEEEGREQVWGITLPMDKSNTSSSAMAALHSQIDGLLERLSSHVPHRLNEERADERRRQIYAFPEQVAGIRPLIENFLEEVFRPNRYSMQPLFRGMYFTSGTQEGAPIDRMNVAYARAFGFDAGQPLPHHGPPKAFFITRLLTDVIFAERGLVGRNRIVERRIFLTYLGAYAACLLTVLGLGALWYRGHVEAESQVVEFNTDFDAIAKSIAEYDANPSLVTALAPLDTMRHMQQLVRRGPIEESLEWIDLDSDAKLRGPINDAYTRLLRRIMLPPIRTRLEDSIGRAVKRKDSEEVTELLTLYLGLGDPEKFDRTALERWMTLEAEQSLPLRPDLQEAVLSHAQALLDTWPGAQPLKPEVIAEARRSLMSVPPIEQIFTTLEAEGNRYPSKDLADIVGLDGLQILVRQSSARAAPQIPYLYTADGFYKIFMRKLPTLGRDQTADDWLIGSEARAANEQDLSTLLDTATKRYTERYIAVWRNLLNDIDIRELRDIGDANSVLATLSGTQSPINRLLGVVADNTELPIQVGGLGGLSVPQGVPGGAKIAGAVSAASSAIDRAGASGAAQGNWPGTPITRAFSDILALVRGSNNQRPGLADIQQEIIAVYGQMNAIDTASDIGKASYEAVRQRLQNKNQRDALSQMATSAVSQPEPLRHILGEIPGSLWSVTLSEARVYLNEQWRRDVVGECTRAVLNRYPVHRDGRDETTLKDFGTFFGPGGTLDGFQTAYLGEFVDTTTRPWKNRLVQGDGLNLSAPFLSALERASVVRSTFFRNGTPSPAVNFTLKPTYLDAQAARVAIDTGSQIITYRHEPPRTFNLTWPDPSSAQQIAITITDTNGNSSSIQTAGPWAWFRLFDQLKLQRTGLADKFVLPIEIRGRKATFELNADSITNPFELPELSEFRCQPGL